jgi:hypothetical protein
VQRLHCRLGPSCIIRTDRCVARIGSTTPKRAGRLADASVDPTEPPYAPGRPLPGEPVTSCSCEVRRAASRSHTLPVGEARPGRSWACTPRVGTGGIHGSSANRSHAGFMQTTSTRRSLNGPRQAHCGRLRCSGSAGGWGARELGSGPDG